MKTEILDPLDLLTWNRFDVAFKLLYLSLKEKTPKFAESVYREHIKAFSEGTYIEPGQPHKNTFSKYVQAFADVHKSIGSVGFISFPNKSPIKLSKDNTFLDGSHRVSSCIFWNRNVHCVSHKDLSPFVFDYNFFLKRHVPIEFIEAAVVEFIKWAKKVHIAFIWPISQVSDDFINGLFKGVVYRKEIYLNLTGLTHLVAEVYSNEPWIGTTRDSYRGAHNKVRPIYKEGRPIRIIVFQEPDENNVRCLKEIVREKDNIGKHSIHITDTKVEALSLSKIIFNENSIHLLKYKRAKYSVRFYSMLDDFKKTVNEEGKSLSSISLDSSSILGAYGLRDPMDIDYFIDGGALNTNKVNCGEHDSELVHHQVLKNDLIYNPRFFFWHYGIKFISFSQIFLMKKNRGEKKDFADLKLMKGLLEKNCIEKFKLRYGYWRYYQKIYLSRKVKLILKKIYLFDVVKKLYYSLRREDSNQ